ncbi:MAG TPA: discoidin domain-containing protein [Polyangia bacterium]|jgi:F5/8 type C domain.|nr:discoidin domain-containing protein [Polyangia bacterium]
MPDEIKNPNDVVKVAPGGQAPAPAPSAAVPAADAASPGVAVAQAETYGGAAASRFWRLLRRFFWMDERMAVSARQSYASGQPGWDEYQLGRAAQIGASQLGESEEGGGSALLLDRAAVMLLIRAHVARAGSELGPAPAGDEYLARLAALPLGGPLLAAMSEEQRGLVTSALGGQGETFLARLPPAKRNLVASALAGLATGLRDPLDSDVRRVGAVLLVRWMRIAVALLVVVGGLAFTIGKAADRPNLALHRPVAVVNPHPQWGKDPNLLVDGDLTNLGFHTLDAINQYVTIDLGKVQRISRAVVYNRADCCKERAVPLKIEVSKDGAQFRQVAERKEQFDKWKADFPSTDARYVRLTHLSASAFHLAEVEVY